MRDTGFTKEQTDALSAKLEAAHVKKNPKGFDYVEGWHAIAEANRIFGFEGWNREIKSLELVTAPYQTGDKWRVAYRATVRVTVITKGGAVVYRDGTGYGSGINKDLNDAHEGAVKEAETDAMKRALMTFGNPFGLALYDKAQENVDRDGGAAKPDPKAIVAEMTKALRGAKDRQHLDGLWDEIKRDFGKIAKADQDAVAAEFDKEAARVLAAEFDRCKTMDELAALWPVAQGYMRPMTDALKNMVTDAKDVRKRALNAGHKEAA
jgi:Recombination DNA repair protein (RAD52 pathway)